jgi:hypothetical protein
MSYSESAGGKLHFIFVVILIYVILQEVLGRVNYLNFLWYDTNRTENDKKIGDTQTAKWRNKRRNKY